MKYTDYITDDDYDADAFEAEDQDFDSWVEDKMSEHEDWMRGDR